MNNLPVGHRWQSEVAFVTLFSFVAFVGCSGGGLSGLHPVKGTVTYNGSPVEGAIISFNGEGDTRPATAVSKADGTYELYTLDSPGAQPGKYIVVVSKTEGPDKSKNADPGFDASGVDLSMMDAAKEAGKSPRKLKSLLPAKFADPGSSPLRFEVKEGTNTFDLKLD